MVKLARRFIASTRAVAAIEFAIIAPMLLVMLIETYDIGNAIAVYMKVRSATFALASITNTYATGTYGIAAANMSDTMTKVSQVLAPYSSSPGTFTVTQIKATSASNATVSWSYSLNGTAYTAGTTWTNLPSQLKGASNNSCSSYPCYLIFAEVSYSYTPFLFSSFMSTIPLADNIYVTPRSSSCVQYLSVPSTC
jgi:Flp pilus assembly protein TadG